MKNIDEVLVGYIRAIIGLDELIRNKAKGDWRKLDILLENDDEARLLDEQMSQYEDEFREGTSLGNIFTFSDELEDVFKALGDGSLKREDKVSLQCELEAARDMIADLTHEDDDRVVALDNLARLPNYNPDDWIRRRYQFQAIYVPLQTDIPPYLVRMLKEANYSFVYGNFLASAALTRAILEYTLKERFPQLKNSLLGNITSNNGWHKIKELKGREEMRKMADGIRDRGNQIMHTLDEASNTRQKNLVYLFNEMTTRQILEDLKSLLQFFYG